MMMPKTTPDLVNIPLGLLKLLVLASFVSALGIYSINFNSTALTWPAVDNLPAVCRLLDSDCLANDFFTNASSTVNPRMPFIYLLSILTDAANNGFGGGLAIVKGILLALLPAITSIVIVTAIQANSRDTSKPIGAASETSLLFACLFSPIVMFFLQWKGDILSVAGWPPLKFEATPHNVALALTLMGFCFLYWGRHFLSFLLVFSGGIVHPAVCIFTSIFACILYGKNFSIKENRSLMIFGLLPSILGVLVVKILFNAEGGLSTEDFVRVYVIERHPHHYLPSKFASSQLPWLVSFSIVLTGLLAISAALCKLDCKAWKNSLAAAAAYALSVSAQYFFVELWPVKFVATLGPSRFTMFGPWFLSIFSLLLILTTLDRLKSFRKLNELLLSACRLIKWRFIFVAGLSLVIIIVLYASKVHRFNFIGEQEKHFFEFVSKSSGKNDVFVLPTAWPTSDIAFQVMTGRGVFFTNAFPFSERYFLEFEKRSDLVSQVSQTPHDFIQIASKYRIDWVVLGSKSSVSFSSCKPSFSSEKFKAFEIETLRKCAK